MEMLEEKLSTISAHKNTKLLNLNCNFAVCYAVICYGTCKPVICSDKWNVYVMVWHLYTMSWNFHDMPLQLFAVLWCILLYK